MQDVSGHNADCLGLAAASVPNLGTAIGVNGSTVGNEDSSAPNCLGTRQQLILRRDVMPWITPSVVCSGIGDGWDWILACALCDLEVLLDSAIKTDDCESPSENARYAVRRDPGTSDHAKVDHGTSREHAPRVLGRAAVQLSRSWLGSSRSRKLPPAFNGLGKVQAVALARRARDHLPLLHALEIGRRPT